MAGFSRNFGIALIANRGKAPARLRAPSPVIDAAVNIRKQAPS